MKKSTKSGSHKTHTTKHAAKTTAKPEELHESTPGTKEELQEPVERKAGSYPVFRVTTKVFAAKIEKITSNPDGSAIITTTESNIGPVKVSKEYMAKNNPKAGGYHVINEKGEARFEEGKVFESTHTQV